jgi:hypothetical protein
MATYKIGGEEVSRSEFQRRVYGRETKSSSDGTSRLSSRSSSSGSSSSSRSTSDASRIDTDRFKKSEFGGYIDTEEQQSISEQEAIRRSIASGFVSSAEKENRVSRSGGSSNSLVSPSTSDAKESESLKKSVSESSTGEGRTARQEFVREAIETSPFITGTLGQSVDTSLISDRQRRVIKRDGKVVGVEDKANKESISGSFSEQRINLAESSRQLRVQQAKIKRERLKKQQEERLKNTIPQQALIDLEKNKVPIRETITLSPQFNISRFTAPREKVLREQEQLPLLENLSRELETKRGELRISRLRGGLTFGEAVRSVQLGTSSVLLGTALLGKSLVTKPVETVSVAGKGLFQIASGQKQLTSVSRSLREEPQFVTGALFGELVTGRGLATASRTFREAADIGTSFIRGGFTPVKKGILAVDDEAIRIFGGADTTSESLAKQALRAGEDVFPVSAQRSLFSPSKPRRVIIDKPKPTPESSELERLFFADPEGRLRTSRLASKRTSSTTDFFESTVQRVTEPITFSKERPQVLFFRRQQLKEFSPNLESVRSGLISGRIRTASDLTPSQRQAFIDFQFEKTGRFSPVGFISKESEITASLGDVLVPERKGFTLISNLEGGGLLKTRATSIFETTLQKADDVDGIVSRSKTGLKKLSESSSFKGLSQRTLSPFISSALRTSYSFSSPSLTSSKQTSIINTSSSSLFDSSKAVSTQPFSFSTQSTQPSSGLKTSSTKDQRTSSIILSSGDSSRTSFSGSSSILGSATSGLGSSLVSTTITPSPKKPLRRRKKDSRVKKKVQAYNAYAFEKGEKIKVNKKPLSREQAINRALNVVDNTASATGFIKKAGDKKIVNPNVKVDQRLKSKFRKGQKKRKNVPVKYTEKNEARIDTFGELRGITAKGIASQRRNNGLLRF